ncbi:MAG TPA: GNAT family N-acetyltransferase [Gaiellaceae bacterium]|nr:GNAT family N-acetyltransferase [Gaiellaceae bacterium]
MSDFARAAAFEEKMRDAAVERVVETRFGPALFNDTYRDLWMLNVLRVEKAVPAGAAELAEEAERVQAGLPHRRVLVLDTALGAHVAPGFAERGWKTDRFVFMALKRPSVRAADTAMVTEVDAGALAELREAIGREQLPDMTPGALRQLRESSAIFEEPGRARHFAVLVDGRVVSATDLFSDGSTAQVEEVATLPEFRGRGYATAVVQRAVDEALATGHDFVFLTADADDWPKELYRRLGFDEVGMEWAFLKNPAVP